MHHVHASQCSDSTHPFITHLFSDLYELVHSACLCVNGKCDCVAGNGYHPSQERDVSGDMCVYLHPSRACV